MCAGGRRGGGSKNLMEMDGVVNEAQGNRTSTDWSQDLAVTSETHKATEETSLIQDERGLSVFLAHKTSTYSADKDKRKERGINQWSKNIRGEKGWDQETDAEITLELERKYFF